MKEKKVKCTSIGGQAVMEGVMMRGRSSTAIAVRDEKGNIRIESKRIKPAEKRNLFLRLPIIRGVVSFFSSLVGGIGTLMRSAEVFGEGEPTKFEKWLAEKLKVNVMGVVTTLSLIIGLALAVFLFIWLPVNLRTWIFGDDINLWAKNFIEGGVKILIFVLYILSVSFIKDIKRTFMYHGAEHKTITCFEKGLPLTVANAKKCSRVHDRCGTTFMVFVLTISIIVFAVFESVLGINGVKLANYLRVLCKIALLPLVAGLSYELLKALAKTDSFLVYPLKVPGLLLQKLTTKEPTEDMLEVAIASFNTVMVMDANPEISTRSFFAERRIKDVTSDVLSLLRLNGIEEKAEAEWIVSIKANVNRDEVYGDKTISYKIETEILKTVNERITGRPLWYCIGDADFMGYILKVDERVLIPRPETEILVESALNEITPDMKVLDLCTGSGAIGIAIALKTEAKVLATDISEDALSLAKENASRLNADVEFIKSDIFSSFEDKPEFKFDVILSNPPYIKTTDIENLQKEIKDFEPKSALDGGIDGLDFYRIIARDVKKYLNDDGKLFLECGEGQTKEIKEMLVGFKRVEIIKDLENVDRIVKAVL